MVELKVIEVTPTELVTLIKEGIKQELSELSNRLSQSGESRKPQLTRKEASEFFGISLNCLNDWSNKGILTPYKVGQRTYFKRSECEEVMFGQKRA